ncbi:MAG: hypothetical protein OEN50_16215, partial [Deltaproteobacteria bacterium]|nr:hypothetical protein [Deltaproteobacteria bacterium]
VSSRLFRRHFRPASSVKIEFTTEGQRKNDSPRRTRRSDEEEGVMFSKKYFFSFVLFVVI